MVRLDITTHWLPFILHSMTTTRRYLCFGQNTHHPYLSFMKHIWRTKSYMERTKDSWDYMELLLQRMHILSLSCPGSHSLLFLLHPLLTTHTSSLPLKEVSLLGMEKSQYSLFPSLPIMLLLTAIMWQSFIGNSKKWPITSHFFFPSLAWKSKGR